MVVFFNDTSLGAAYGIGGKNAHLLEVKQRLKLSVPDAFVITTHAFDEMIRQNGLDKKIDELTKGSFAETATGELQALIIGADIPPGVHQAVQDAIEKIRARCGEDCFLAVRSSADEEDSVFSFAGQFETVLNVPLRAETVEGAYKKVIASLFSSKAFSYQKQLEYNIGWLKMAVGCMVMVDAASSGVIYSVNPDENDNTMIINATFGLGSSVVEGKTDADHYVVRKEPGPELLDARYGKKESMVVGMKQGGIAEIDTPSDLRSKPSLAPEQISELARQAMKIEKYFGGPQDIEWAIAKDGGIVILQTRALIVKKANKAAATTEQTSLQPDTHYHLLMQNRGTVVQSGAGAGKVFILRETDEIDNFPRGAVLVAKHDSSLFVKVMPYAAAIITETGTMTSHMSAICRELKVPTIVNAGDAARVLEQGQDITVVASDDNTSTVYRGINREILAREQRNSANMDDVFEFRKKRYLLRYISPLNLVDPLMEEFTPEGCRTMHDVLRFIHEKSVAGLVDSAREESTGLRRGANVMSLDLPVPAGIVIMDMGGGLDMPEGSIKAAFENITSVPFKAFLKGMLHPGAWRSEAVSLKAGDFFTSMMRMSDIATEGGDLASYNIAVISKEYLNLSLRFGYHFSMLDCYCSENARNNHIYFRFVGGATDIVKRSRRVDLISAILKKYGFNIKTKGDLVIARLANLPQVEMADILDQLGRLIAYTRQLDAMLHDDVIVEMYAKRFMQGDYGFKANKSVL
jgi:pyruvate,water dikinase